LGEAELGRHALCLAQPLSRKRAEVFDVVRDHGPAFAACDLEDDPVTAPSQVLTTGNVDVVAGLAQQDRDLPKTRRSSAASRS